ncbi:MAG: hypothetical protein ABL874_12945, partial [Sphingopyxis sp.]
MARILSYIAALLFAAAMSAPATAQQVVRSTTVDATSVTVYRAPYRSSGGTLDLDELEGFALISETRTITLPDGEA